jgi:LmbE family N-acetylglucosaminyl deacetylase
MSLLNPQGALRVRSLVSLLLLGLATVSLAVLSALVAAPAARAQLLVIAPHPDDDLITSAGVMLRARQSGETVRVVFMTNGDIAGMTSGLLRQDEAVAAELLLNVPETNMIFLGYPDGSLQDLRGAFAGSGTALTGPSGLTHTYGDRGLGFMDYHRHVFGSSANNNGANVRTDLAHVLTTYQPAHIFVTSEFDEHPDHEATYQFLIDALATAIAATPSYNPTVHKTIVWNDFGDTESWPNAANPTTFFSEPPGLLARTSLVWAQRESLDVPLEAQLTTLTSNLKWRAIDSHQSQGGATGSYIGQFLHKDEWFFSARAQGANRPPVPNAGADQTANAGASVTLTGSASFDPDGTALTYQWQQTAGPAVTLSSTSAAQPTFTVPVSITEPTTFAFQLRVGDGSSTSVADGVSVRANAGSTPPPGTNLALAATATASSQRSGQEAGKVRDGLIGGAPTNPTQEWSSSNQGAFAWVQLTWPTPQTINQVVLFDRPNANDRVLAGTLTFSSGSSIAVGALDNAGAARTVAVPSRSVTWVRFTVSQVASTTTNVGLAELRVFNQVGAAPVASAGANQSVVQGATVTLNGSASSDPEGAGLTYAWTQLSGPSVALSDATAPSPSFVAPGGTTAAQTLTFRLIVHDGTTASSAAQTNVTVTAPAAWTNLALSATASASSQVSGQEASKVRDGLTGGFPANPTQEWSSNGQGALAWVQLNWPAAQTIDRVVLFDRPNSDDRVLSGTLTFSHGASVAVGALPNAGTALAVPVSVRNVTWVRFTVSQVAATTFDIGLAELQVFNTTGSPPPNQPPVASPGANQSVAQGATVTLNGSGSSDPEGATLSYAWSQVSGPAVTLSSTTAVSPTFTAPGGSSSAQTLVFQLIVNDGTQASSPAQTTVTVNAPAGGGTNLALTATATASSQVTAQEASKVIDGSTDGHPVDGTREWSSNAEGVGAWVQLTWSSAQTIDQVVLFDRPNTEDQILAGTLTFSSGASVSVGTLSNTGAALTVSFSSRSVTWVRLTVTQVAASTLNVGLAEMRVFNTGGGGNQPPVASAGSNQTVAQGASVTLNGSGSSDPEGATLSYAWSQVSGPAVTLSSTTTVSPTFTAPGGSSSAQTLVFQLIVNDGTNASSPAQTTVTVSAPTNQPPVASAGANQSVAQAATVTLNGSGSSDPEGATLSYAWSQLSGPSVTLSSASAVSPTFTAPSGSSSTQTLVFQLIVHDGTHASSPAQTSVSVNPPSSTNFALTATATASSEVFDQEASKVRDGFTDGYPVDGTHEWSSLEQGVGAWVQLTWSSAQTINQVVLYDRPNTDDQILAGTLTFSSGASVAVGTLNNTGSPLTVNFSSRSVTWVRLTVTQVSPATGNIGLAEMRVFNSSTGNQAPIAVAGANQTVDQGTTVTLNGSGSSDPEGATLTYDWTQTVGPAVLTVENVANPTFTAPSGSSSNVTLSFELVVNDGALSSTPSSTTVTVIPPPTGTNHALTATATASSSSVGQGPEKANDGVAEGYPVDYEREWSSLEQGVGAWLQLTWSSARTISSVRLFDRPNLDDHVLSGTLTFSSGASVAVGALSNSGAGVTVSFSSRSVTWVRFTVNTVSLDTYNVGLSEFEVR